MSSIYKKGRDGYFYYQTYVFNPDSGKKDKKIFHALGTKDRDSAIRKQKKFDHIYSKKKLLQQKSNSGIYFNFRILGTFSIVLILICILLVYRSNSNEKRTIVDDGKVNSNFVNDKGESLKTNLNNIPQKVNGGDIENIKDPHDSSRNHQIEKINRKVKLTYDLRRLEKSSKNFSQIKIFLTVSQNYNRVDMENISNALKNKYSQYLNHIICFYSDTKDGKNIADGKKVRYSNKVIQKNWLGMYTYNPVEGGFFDINPGEFLGSYQ